MHEPSGRRALGGLRLLLAAWLAVAAACACAADGASPRAMQHYQLLEGALARYQSLARQPALTQLPPLPRRAVRAGESYDGIDALRRLLVALGDLPDAAAAPAPATPEVSLPGVAAPPLLDAALVAALQRFQERHGLAPDGVLGPATWRALTTPLSARVRQIERTLQRWSNLPVNPHSRAIFINIPRFRLYALRAGDDREAAVLQMDVVVGRAVEKLRTPVFTADMTHLIFRPWWEVPRSIALGEILPAARRNAGYFARRHLELVDGTGRVVPYTPAALDAVASGALRIRQRPGADNALGAVKFMLPNPHNVYLHDTPERSLFARTTRAFSHGCIRVSDPAGLAQWLLDDPAQWSAAHVAEAMARTEPLQVNLREPVRVYIVYGTAVAREDGSVLFLEDLYGLDRD